jgi:hypothetical protein
VCSVGISVDRDSTRALVSLAQRKGKEKKGEKVAFVGIELTPSAIRAVVLSQLD